METASLTLPELPPAGAPALSLDWSSKADTRVEVRSLRVRRLDGDGEPRPPADPAADPARGG